MADPPELHIPPDPGDDVLTQEEQGAEGILQEEDLQGVQQITQLPGNGVPSSLTEGDSVPVATNQVRQDDGGDGAVGTIGDGEVDEGEDAAFVEPQTVKNGKYTMNVCTVFILET